MYQSECNEENHHYQHQPSHSFPTRRSSDLALHRLRRGIRFEPERHRARPRGPQPEADAAGVAPARIGCRSEEHTSELQSRFDLVCRLLLEKKKLVKLLKNNVDHVPIGGFIT